MEENARSHDGHLKLALEYPSEYFSDHAVDLLKLLFEPNPKLRLGAKDVSEIKNHRFFASINWELLAAKEVKPPFIPDHHTVHANSIGEVGEFNKRKFKRVKLTAEEQKLYKSFDYVNDAGIEEELLNTLIQLENPPMVTKQSQSLDGEVCICCTIL